MIARTWRALVYYVRPHPLNALKWNSTDNLVHWISSISTPTPAALHRRATFLPVRSDTPILEHIVVRFASAGPIEHHHSGSAAAESRSFVVR